MYKEVVASVNKTIFIVIGAIAAALVLMGAVDLLAVWLRWPYQWIYQIITLMLVAYGLYVLIRHNLSHYQYFLIEDELILSSKLGMNERAILRVPVSEITAIYPCGCKEEKNQKVCGRYNARKNFFRKCAYVGFFLRDGKLYKFSFEPTSHLLSLLERHGVQVKRAQR